MRMHFSKCATVRCAETAMTALRAFGHSGSLRPINFCCFGNKALGRGVLTLRTLSQTRDTPWLQNATSVDAKLFLVFPVLGPKEFFLVHEPHPEPLHPANNNVSFLRHFITEDDF